MTIEEIAKTLDDCANHRNCEICKFSFYGLPTMECEGHMIASMGSEVRKFVDKMGDDGK